VRVLIFKPHQASSPMPAILHIHGGGYMLGKPEDSWRENLELALHCGCMVVSVDYRLAPETQYPGSLDDCHAVLQWLHESAPALGIDPSRIAVKGESAGGGLAACLALKARDQQKYPICCQVLIAPMLDDRAASYTHPYAGEFIWTKNSNRFAWQAYLGDDAGGNDVSPYAAAARAEDLTKLPPLFLAVGALDLFFEQNMEYVRRLNRAGVATELHVYPGAYHSFHRAGDTSLSKRLWADYRRALMSALRE
jgi:triacylglycerol lipase